MSQKYSMFSKGDVSATFALIFDVLTCMFFNASILIYGYGYPAEIVSKYIIPGTAAGVIIGNLLFVLLDYRLYRRTGKLATAIPFGIDAPTAIAVAVCIIGPLYKDLIAIHDANPAINAWIAGVSSLFLISLIKIFASFFSNSIKKHLPRVALLGAISGVAVAFIGFIPLNSLFQHPVVGLLSMGIIFTAMFAEIQMPFKLPGILFAILLGTICYYIIIGVYYSHELEVINSNLHFAFNPPILSLDFLSHLSLMLKYFSIALPLAVLTIVGSLTITESANAEGVDYRSRDLILIDGIASMVACFFGGIMQTTPYAGYPAYKKMGARAGFLLINSIILIICASFGLLSICLKLIPEAALAPVLLFVAFEIVSQSFVQSDRDHFPVVIFAILPAIAKLITIKITDPSIITSNAFQKLAFLPQTAGAISDKLILIMLGNGFIITGLLWGGLLYFAIEHKWLKCIMFSLTLALLSYFGIIHSIFISGVTYLPWTLAPNLQQYPQTLAIGYLALACLMAIIALRQKVFKN
jgi:AGZA family xanthine/uracil permease-like MFS transporter